MKSIPDHPLVSVIIPSGRPRMVQGTIQALTEQQCGPMRYEVILVTPFANESKQGLPKSIRIIEVDKLYPPGRMRNIGAAEAQGELFAFIDDDCIPPANWLTCLVNRLVKEKNVGAVGCRLVSSDKNYMSRCADHCLFTAYQYRDNRKIALGSAAIVVKRSTFEDVCGFDEDLLASEDWDFSLRLLDKGVECFFDAGVTVIHNHGRGKILSIIKGAYLSGYRSGLFVQSRHRNSLSWLARLSVVLGSPWLYWLLILPYSLLLTLAQAVENFRNEFIALLYLPLYFLARMCYHLGVWNRLLHEKVRS